MAGNKSSSNKKDKAGQNEGEIKKTFKEAKNDPAVKQAMKKEKQPGGADDLSPLHNTREIGTSGGDQRAREVDPKVK